MKAYAVALLLAVAAACAPMASAAGAGDPIDPVLISDPRRASLPTRAAQRRWEALFTAGDDWPARHLRFLAETDPERFAVLLTSRLLWRGDPSDAGVAEARGPRRWRAADREVRLACLREIRASRDPVYGVTLRHYLATEGDDSGLILSALATWWLIDPQASTAAAARLSDPRREDRLPGAALSGVRSRALAFLAETSGLASDGARTGLEWGLLRAGGPERVLAIGLIPPGTCGDLLTLALIRLAAEQRRELAFERDPLARSAFLLACARTAGRLVPAVAAALGDLAINGEAAIAAAAAASLERSAQWNSGLDQAGLVARARSDTDPVVRHALTSLLLRINPTAAAAAAKDGSASARAWELLSAHRSRLAAWDAGR